MFVAVISLLIYSSLCIIVQKQCKQILIKFLAFGVFFKKFYRK